MTESPAPFDLGDRGRGRRHVFAQVSRQMSSQWVASGSAARGQTHQKGPRRTFFRLNDDICSNSGHHFWPTGPRFILKQISRDQDAAWALLYGIGWMGGVRPWRRDSRG